MKCPKCQGEIPEGKKYCSECGAKLELLCPQCHSSNPPPSKFCGDCGQKLEAPTLIEKPLPLTGSERKHVTALFSDMSGYTAMTEKLDPEEVKEIMGRIFGEISQVVARYEGFIEKFIGDAVMALFGAVTAHEDDPVRAIKAAREIHDVVSSFSPKYEKRIDKPLAMHTGICTGLVVTGDVNLEKGTHGVLGDTINTAARLSSLAKPGEIVISSETYHQAEGYFTFEPMEATTVKGKTSPVKPYRALSPREEPTKTHRISGIRAELIGRKVEMAQLQEALQNLKQGKGFIFSIVGDAGTGKSRLIEEFKATIHPDEVQWREGHAYAYSQNIPYSPVIDLLSRAWQVHEGDSIEQVRQKVESGARSRLGDREDLIPYVGSLFSLQYPEIEHVSPEIWKTRLNESIQLILADICKQAPTIICIEDLHWADSSSVELLRSLLKDSQLPAVFICAYRPSFNLFTSHQLTSLSKVHSEISLQDLSSSEAQTMVESLLKTDAIPSELRKFIQTKVEGNPFYLEEAINSLMESETLILDSSNWKLTKHITEAVIPSTVQGIIAARIDRLERESKRILQEASVIGRAFLYEILKRITDLKDVVDKSLSGLERLDFIRTRTLQPDLEYIFKHALTQEVVYNGVLKKERQVLHERIGIVIEQLFPDRLTELYETLAYHYKQGQSVLKAIDYLVKAGEKSFKRYALDEAHLYFKEAYDLLSNKPERTEKDDDLLIDIIIKWGYVYHHHADYIGLINLLKAHEVLAESHANKEQLAMFYSWLGLALSRRDVPIDSHQYLLKALHLAEEIGDVKAVGHNCAWLSQVCSDLGHLDDAVSFGERARDASNRFESDSYLFRLSLVYSAYAHYFRGDVRKIAELATHLVDYGKRHSDMRCMANYYIAMGQSRLPAGDYPSAIEYFNDAVHISPDPVMTHSAKMLLGQCYLRTGQLKEAQNNMEEVIEFSETYGFEWVGAMAQAMKGMVLIAEGDLNRGVSMFEEVIRTWLINKSLYRYANGNYLMGRVYSKIAQGGGEKKDFSFFLKNFGFLIRTVPFAYQKAVESLNVAIKTSGEIGAKSVYGQAYLELGILHKARGKTDKARECISNAIEAFEKCEADVFLQQAREALASLG
jgi:class 3 adenylate cyclase/tetratricopeptide (TPR) repeat protein